MAVQRESVISRVETENVCSPKQSALNTYPYKNSKWTQQAVFMEANVIMIIKEEVMNMGGSDSGGMGGVGRLEGRVKTMSTVLSTNFQN